MGTILNGQAEVFRTITAGVAKHDGVQLVLSIVKANGLSAAADLVEQSLGVPTLAGAV
jgi:hypothetical protein